MIMKIRRFILLLFKPIQILMQRFGKPEPKMTRSKVDAIVWLAEPGMGLASYESLRVTNSFIKGEFDHFAIISPKMTVIEAVGDDNENGVNIGGVREVDLEEWLFKKDRVALIEVNTTDEAKNYAAANAVSFIGLGYNYAFDLFDKTKMFCSGLFFHCYFMDNKNFMSEFLKERKTILPQDYYNLTIISNDFKLICDSSDNHD